MKWDYLTGPQRVLLRDALIDLRDHDEDNDDMLAPDLALMFGPEKRAIIDAALEKIGEAIP